MNYKGLKIKNLFMPLVVAFLAVFSAILFYFFQLSQWNDDQQIKIRFFQQSFQASINQYEYLPALLAKDDKILNLVSKSGGNQHEVNTKLKFIQQQAGANAVYIMNAEGTVVASSNFDQENSFLNRNYSFRPYFQRAVLQKQKQFYYAIGATTGVPGFFISQPILGDGVVIGVAVVKIDLREWEENWRQTQQQVMVVNDKNVVILSGSDQWRYRSVGNLESGVRQQINTHKQFSDYPLTPLFESEYLLRTPWKVPLKFWQINNKSYLVNSYPIVNHGWSLFFLKPHQELLVSTFLSFIVIFFGLLLTTLYYQERMSRLKSRELARENETRHKQELETMIENIQIAVLSINEEGYILFLNKAARFMLKNSNNQENLKISKVHDLLEMKNFDDHLKNGEKDKGVTIAFQETCLNAGENIKIPVMFAVSPVQMAGKKQYLVTIVNISKRKQAEDEILRINESLEEQVEKRTKALRDAQAELVQQSKAAALGKMAATIVHELSQPLSALNSSVVATRLKAENEDWKGALKSLSRLTPLGDKMNKVIKLLKYYSYPDKETLEPQDIAGLIRDSLQLYRDRFLEKKTHIDFDDLQDEVYVKINPLKFDLVLINIVQNAIDAMAQSEQSIIKVRLTSASGKAHLIVEDSGNGIDSRVMGQLFDLYYTTKEIGKGLGLGLSICHEIIREYKGSISAENTDTGARFIVSLPCSAEASLRLVQ